MTDKAKNEYQHNDDGTTYIFIESKNKYAPGAHVAIVDTKHWNKVKGYRWTILKNASSRYPYAQTSLPHPSGEWRYYTYKGEKIRQKRRTTLTLHHLILGKPEKGMQVDHKNHNGLDNREENLGAVTRAENQRNRRSQKNSSSNYKGVSWDKQHKKWSAHIWNTEENKLIHLGRFTCEKEAARAYNKKALELWGDEHVLLNEVEGE